MLLHKDKDLFSQLIIDASVYLNIEDRGMIEKDYYITCFLYELVKRQPDIIFKGGTSLSKCYKIINRFSEDIDLSVEPRTDKVTEGQRKKLKKDIQEIIADLEFALENPDNVRSRRALNQYIINYHPLIEEGLLSKHLIVETAVFIKSFPNETKEVSSLVYDYLKVQNADSTINMYELKPFNMNVQSLERTFVDKTFAIADYYLDGKSIRLSRHIYDLYKIYPQITFNKKFTGLVAEVRKIRKEHNTCLSARDGVDLQNILNKIINENYYKQDYEQITKSMLFEEMPYSKAITVVSDIIKTGSFGQ